MIVNIGISAVLITVGMIFLNDVHLFWSDRTLLGNIVISAAVVVLIAWISYAVYLVWS